MLWIYTHSPFFLLGSKHVCTHGLFSLYPYSSRFCTSISIVWKAFWWCAHDTWEGQNICQKTTTGIILKFSHKTEAGYVAGTLIFLIHTNSSCKGVVWKILVSLDYNLTYIKFQLHILYNTFVQRLFSFWSYRNSKLVYKEKNKWVIRCVASPLIYLECMKIHGGKYKNQF